MADHTLFAAVYDRVMAPAERRGLADRRARLLGGAAGRVLEVGAGTGANLAHYRDITSLAVAEPDPGMRHRLEHRLAAATVPVEVLDAGAARLPFPDGSFDTVVSTLVLCTVPDSAAALAEIRRVLRADGRLLFLEHVRGTGLLGHVQHGLAPAWRRVAGGCCPDRDTVGAVRAAGFLISDLERFELPAAMFIVRPCVQGVARPHRLDGAAA